MPATKRELTAYVVATRAELERAIAAVPLDRRESPLPSGLTVKDLLVHVTFWEQYLVDRLVGCRTGQGFPTFAVEADAEIDQVNARVYAENKERSWADVWKAFQSTQAVALTEIERLSDDELFDPAHSLAIIGDAQHTTSDHIYWESAEHFVEHAHEIEAWLDSGLPLAAD